MLGVFSPSPPPPRVHQHFAFQQCRPQRLWVFRPNGYGERSFAVPSFCSCGGSTPSSYGGLTPCICRKQVPIQRFQNIVSDLLLRTRVMNRHVPPSIVLRSYLVPAFLSQGLGMLFLFTRIRTFTVPCLPKPFATQSPGTKNVLGGILLLSLSKLLPVQSPSNCFLSLAKTPLPPMFSHLFGYFRKRCLR